MPRIFNLNTILEVRSQQPPEKTKSPVCIFCAKGGALLYYFKTPPQGLYTHTHTHSKGNQLECGSLWAEPPVIKWCIQAPVQAKHTIALLWAVAPVALLWFHQKGCDTLNGISCTRIHSTLVTWTCGGEEGLCGACEGHLWWPSVGPSVGPLWGLYGPSMDPLWPSLGPSARGFHEPNRSDCLRLLVSQRLISKTPTGAAGLCK